MYFLKPISDDIRFSQMKFKKQTKTKKFVLVSIFACIAAIFQAAGGYLPGIGLLFSPFATVPILLISMFSVTFGIKSYFLTLLLLIILQPTELIVFPFTTGLLAIGIGAGYYFFKTRLSIIVSGTSLLTFGIISLLFIFHFPVLGPVISDGFSILTTGMIILFTFLYSWFWVEITFVIFKRIAIIII